MTEAETILIVELIIIVNNFKGKSEEKNSVNYLGREKNELFFSLLSNMSELFCSNLSFEIFGRKKNKTEQLFLSFFPQGYIIINDIIMMIKIERVKCIYD